MFTIRERHHQALAFAKREDFVRRAARSLRERFEPARQAADPALHPWIDQGIDDAERYGLYAESEVQTLLDYRMVFGETFPEMEDTAWALAILSDERMAAPDKLRRLDEQFARMALGAGDRDDNS